jgi:acyl-CoA thioester hydrolase
MSRGRGTYFKREPGAPAPVSVEITRRVGFSESDPMGIAWFGRYPLYFEEGSAALGRKCGLGYGDFFEAGLRAPVVECHVDYHAPLMVDEVFTILARMVWCEGARLNTEYELRGPSGVLANSGYTVQMLVKAPDQAGPPPALLPSAAGAARQTPILLASAAGEVCLVPPPLLVRVRERWLRGEIK